MKLKTNKVSCFEFALLLCEGNLTMLARAAGCTPQAVSQWRKTGVVPVNRVPSLAKKLKTQRSKLNPIFAE